MAVWVNVLIELCNNSWALFVQMIQTHKMVRKQRTSPKLPEKSSHVEEISEDNSNDDSEVENPSINVLEQYAKSSVLVIVPVSITLLLVVIFIHILCVSNRCIHIPLDEMFPLFSKTDTKDMNTNAKNALKNTGVLLTYIVVATFALLALIYFRLYRVLLMFGILLVIILCTMKTLLFWHNIFFAMDVNIDQITVGIFVWNLVLTGLIIFFMLKSPLLIQQIYLIYISLLVSNFIITLLTPSTAWGLLGFLIIWDLIAVLTPCGPLNLMIKLIRERQRQKEDVYLPPVLIYSTMLFLMAEQKQNEQEQKDGDEITVETKSSLPGYSLKHRPNLGLGDFIFYSLLVGQVRQLFTLLTVIGSILSILTGLIATLFCLLWFRRPLPALPISLTIAIGTVLVFNYCAEPFAKHLNSNLIFI